MPRPHTSLSSYVVVGAGCFNVLVGFLILVLTALVIKQFVFYAVGAVFCSAGATFLVIGLPRLDKKGKA